MLKNKPLILFFVLSTAAILSTALVGMVLIPETVKLGQMYLRDVNINSIPDGTYHGSAETVMAAAEVVVTVNDQRITAIDLTRHVHSNGQEAEAVLDRVIEEQCLKIDLISGATTSSMVLLKAVEDALIE